MFLNQDRLDAMSISEARRMGYMVDSTPNRVVFRSAYNQPHSTITEACETKLKGVVHTQKKLFTHSQVIPNLFDLSFFSETHIYLEKCHYVFCIHILLFKSLYDFLNVHVFVNNPFKC